ncbi:MAG: hypothetical protein HY928_00610, partial [Elusimicrobia bacterium]|nr:hypothetical protein [Elusimicrobiota bacterium]
MSLPIKKTVAAALSLSLILSALPGEALAQMVAGRAVSVPVVPNLAAPAAPTLVSPSLSLQPSLPVAAAPALASVVPSALPTAPKAFAAASPLAQAAPAASAQAAAQAAPAGQDRSVMGTLRAAVSGLAKAAGLSGPGLKTEAGRFFEGPSRFFGGGVPAAANGVDNPGGRGLVPYGPTPEQERQLEGIIRTSMNAGQVLKPLEAAALGKRMGMGQDAALKALSNMADRGLLAAYGNAQFSVVLWHPSERAGDPSFEGALAHARTGVEFVNRDGFRDHAKAIHSFDEAAARFKSLEGRAAQENRRLVEVLRANASLELMRDVTKDLESQLTTRAEEARVAQTLAVVRRVSSWLGTAAMAPGALPAIDAALAGDLKRLADAVDPARRETGSDGEAVAAGVRTMQAVIASLQRSVSPKPAAVPAKTAADAAVEAKARESGFPLIAKDDKKYENLNKYGSNLTAKAVEGKLTPMIGRKAELRQMVKTLMR